MKEIVIKLNDDVDINNTLELVHDYLRIILRDDTFILRKEEGAKNG